MIVVAGVAGRVGATTVALAAATLADQARHVEASPLQLSGLSLAAEAELGMGADGWRSSDRDGLRIERRAFDDAHPVDVTPPGSTTRSTTVVDVGWPLNSLSSTNGACWLSQSLTQFPLVLVTSATAPGMRSLESALARVGRDDVTVVATGAASTRRWSSATKQALRTCPTVSAIADAGRLRPVPFTRSLRDGITEAPLPPVYLSAVADAIAPLLTSEGTHHDDPH